MGASPQTCLKKWALNFRLATEVGKHIQMSDFSAIFMRVFYGYGHPTPPCKGFPGENLGRRSWAALPFLISNVNAVWAFEVSTEDFKSICRLKRVVAWWRRNTADGMQSHLIRQQAASADLCFRSR